MRGILGIDVLIGLLLLLTVASSMLPAWESFKSAALTALCSYKNDVYTYLNHLGQEANVTVTLPSLNLQGVGCS